jgi:hypothetical protein
MDFKKAFDKMEYQAMLTIMEKKKALDRSCYDG